MTQTSHIQRICLLAAGALLMAACQNQPTSVVSAPTRSAPGAANRPGNGARANATALPTGAVAPVTLLAVDGALALASPLVSAAFTGSGKVTAVHVSPGQTVKKGDVLAELDATALNTAVQQAQDQFTLKQAQITSSLSPGKQSDIDNAKTALSLAYASYNELKKGPNANDVDIALRSWNQAKNSLYSSQLGRDGACNIKPGYSSDDDWKKAMGDPKCKQADISVQSAVVRERSAYQAYLDAQAPATDDALAKAWSSIVQAQASLTTLQNGASAEQKVVYDLQLQQAQATVDRARRDLAKAKLISPCDCAVQVIEGLSVGSNASGSVTLLDLAQLKFLTSNLSEQDVVKLKVGQTVTFRLKAFDQSFTGKVAAILPISSGTAGTLSLYTAVLDIDPTPAALLPGMTGQAAINQN